LAGKEVKERREEEKEEERIEEKTRKRRGRSSPHLLHPEVRRHDLVLQILQRKGKRI